MKLEYSLIPYTKINSKCIKDLNVRPDTIKQRKTGRTLLDINHGNVSLVPPPKVMKIKTKIDTWDLVKLRNFCTAKETINKIKRQCTEWEKIFANDVTYKGLISKIYTQLMQLNIKKTNHPIKKWAEDLNRRFSKKYIQVAKST